MNLLDDYLASLVVLGSVLDVREMDEEKRGRISRIFSSANYWLFKRRLKSRFYLDEDGHYKMRIVQ